jgi:DNA-binding PadR family transcriptional regulator
MEDRKLVDSAWDVSDSGPAKRRFRLTAAGRKCMAKWIGTVQEYHQQVGHLLGYLKKQSKTRRKQGCLCGGGIRKP